MKNFGATDPMFSLARRCSVARLGAFLAATLVLSAGAQEPPAAAPEPAVTAEGRPIATELPPDLLRLLDAARRLNDEPGLILNRKAIYATLGVRPQGTKTFVTNDGGRHMGEALVFEQQPEVQNWEGSLGYNGHPEKDSSWVVRVKVTSRNERTCYSSRQVEAYWGKPLVYRPFGVHAFMDELLRKQRGAPPTGPHDGEPYYPEFHASHKNSANVIFAIGPGGCLVTITMSKLFKLEDYNDDQIYHE